MEWDAIGYREKERERKRKRKSASVKKGR